MKQVRFITGAAKALNRLPPRARRQIGAKLRRYAETGTGDVKALVGVPGLRLRAGDYRVVFVETADEIQVVAVGDRRDVYG